jgi:hypothetical protein
VTDEPTSGNRWEPPSAGAPAEARPDDVAPARAGWRRRLTAPRTGLTAGAAVLILGGGAAGFAVGHAAADDEPTPPGQTRFDPDGDGHRPGFGDHDDGPGTVPGQGGDGSGAGES